jgi:hypothetical protein
VPDQSPEPPRFSLVRGGAILRLERLLGRDVLRPPTRAVLGVVVTAVPLVVLAAAQGVLFGVRVSLPLVYDWTVYVRFLFALPMLLLVEEMIDLRLSMMVRYFRTSGLLEDRGRKRLEVAIRQLERSRDSLFPETAMLVGAVALSWFSTRHVLGLPVTSWQALAPGSESSVTWAGRWFDLVSLPFLQFLIYRWLWRIGLWARLLMRVSRLELVLIPTHPDRAGGLGILGEVHSVFGLFLAPLSAVMASRALQSVQFGAASLTSLRGAMVGWAVLALAITLGPLMVFVPKLLAARRLGLDDYGALAIEYTHGFDQKWVRAGRPREQDLLGTSDIQSLADLSNSFAIVDAMRFMPPSLRNALSLLIAALLPILPLLAAVMPVEDILKQLAQLVMR